MNFICKTMRKYKRILAVMLMVIMTISCSGCSNVIDSLTGDDDIEYEEIIYSYYAEDDDTLLQTDTLTNRTLYEAEFMEIATGTHIVPRLVTTNGNCLYYVTMEGENSENAESYTIWCENFENDHSTEQITQLPTDNQIMQIAVDKEQNIYLFTKTRVDIEAGEISRYYITKYKKTGDVVLHKEITEDIVCDEQPKQLVRRDNRLVFDSFFLDTKFYYSPYDIAGVGVSKNGIIYAANEKGIATFNSKGKKIAWMEESNSIKKIINDRDGDTYAVYAFASDYSIYNNSMVADKIRSINSYGKLSNTGYDLPWFSNREDTLIFVGESICSAGMNYDMLTKSSFGLYGVNFEDRNANEILIWANAGIDGKNIDYIAELADGRFLAISHCFDDEPVEAAIISPKKTNPENEPKIITVGVYWMDEYTQNAVIEYNKSQDDHIVQLVLANSVAEGSQCDIFAIDGNSELAEQYVSEGKIEDLTPYFEASTKVNTDDFLPQVVEAHTYDGLLIGIPSTVYLKATNKESAGGTKDWTLTDMQKIIGNNPELKEQLNAYTVAYTLAYYNCHDSINFDVVSHYSDNAINSEDNGFYFHSYSQEATNFEQIVTYAKTFSTKTHDDSILPEGFMKPADSLIYIDSINRFYMYMEDNSSTYEELNPNNIDSYSGILSDNGATYCISTLSANKSESWQFLESMLSATTDPSFRFGTEIKPTVYGGEGIPTRIDIIEKLNYHLIDLYANDYTDQFIQLVSESTYMKYNISAYLMDWISGNIDSLINGYAEDVIHNMEYSMECRLIDYINYYYR